MKYVSILIAAAVMLGVGLSTEPAEARSGVSFGYHGPNVSIYVGPRPYYYRYYYRPYVYRPYVYRRHYYRPPVYRGYSARCTRWSRRCGRNWGYRNRNYYGCMRYHGCR